jgi:release factor glutamine methyltransferase
VTSPSRPFVARDRGVGHDTCYTSRMQTMTFGRLTVRYDRRVLEPRAWTLAQSRWAVELADALPAGPLLELCAGVGHIGLDLASLVRRDLVLVDADAHACEHARHNAEAAALPVRVEVRHGPLDAVVEPQERFALILADPPWVPTAETSRFPADPLPAIDGGHDGLDHARTCVGVIGRHLAEGGASILQLGDQLQAAAIGAHLEARPEIGLGVDEVRDVPGANGLLVRLSRRAPGR